MPKSEKQVQNKPASYKRQNSAPTELPFKPTIRLQVNLPHNQLMVLRLMKNTSLADIKDNICKEKSFSTEKYQLVKPFKSTRWPFCRTKHMKNFRNSLARLTETNLLLRCMMKVRIGWANKLTLANLHQTLPKWTECTNDRCVSLSPIWVSNDHVPEAAVPDHLKANLHHRLR